MANTININFKNLHLTKPSMAYIDSYRAAILEYRLHGVEDFAYPGVTGRKGAEAYFRSLDRFCRGIDVPVGAVPYSAFWLVDGHQYLGSGDVRHYLNDNLRRLGGNIGYSVRPSVWRQGLGALQMALLLDEASKLCINRPVVTCFDTNIPSAKIIEKNGGVLMGKVDNYVNSQIKLTRIYEII